MKQITFDTYKSYDDLLMVLGKKTLGSPEPKTYTVEVEGGDGVLDYTEYFGDVNYNNYECSFEFTLDETHAGQPELHSTIKNLIHGKKMRVYLDDKPGYYLMARITVGELSQDRTIGTVTISCDCEPYYYKTNRTTVSGYVSGSETVTLNNLRMRTVPTITTDASMTFAFNGYTVTHSAGTFIIPELELTAGSNTVTLTGTGNASFVYQEGGL